MYTLSKNIDFLIDTDTGVNIPISFENRDFEEVFNKLSKAGLVIVNKDGSLGFKPDNKILSDYDDTEDILFEARAKRLILLQEADVKINILEDNGGDSKDFRAYRQALRDITKQKGFPKKVTWPKEPK